MAIPKFSDLMLPLLSLLRDEKDHTLRESVEYLGNHFELDSSEKAQLLPSGTQQIIVNRTGWARTFLKKAEFIEYPRRGTMKITDRGLDYLRNNPQQITVQDLRKFPEFEANWHPESITVKNQTVPINDLTPEERIEEAFDEIKADLIHSLLEKIHGISPAFFEKLVVDVLLSMGYGGSLKDAGQAIGRSGDGGIDGVIKEDRLGLDAIYIQAKRWESVIGRPEIQKFAGALIGIRAKKGVFISTSRFTEEAKEYASQLDVKIVLIDGQQLCDLMIEHNVGVSSQSTYVIKKMDVDYFAEE